MNKKVVLTGIVMLVVGLGGGYGLTILNQQSLLGKTTDAEPPLYYRSPMDPTVTSPVPTKDSMGMDYLPVFSQVKKAVAPGKVLFYRNAMNPSVTSPIAAKDSMGMDYIPVYEKGGAGDDSVVKGTVEIDPVVVQNIGVRTGFAELTTISRTVRAAGRVDFDEERMAHLHPKIEGWIEKINVDKTGEHVNKGDILVSVYSPKLVSTQQEYLLALNNLAALEMSPFKDIRKGAEDLVNSSRERLVLLDVPEHQIQELENTRKIKKTLHIHTPVSGTVIRVGSRKGQYVTPKTELYMIVDLNKVWVYADIYEYELPWIKIGDKVEMTLESVPGKTFTGHLEYIYPYAEAKTRTTKVRLVFNNQKRLLRPEMLADIIINSGEKNETVVVPSAAVIRSGDRTQVFVVRDKGKFEPRLVTIGVESKGKVSIINGLDAGEEVVISAQFLIDSESKLREATAKMLETLKVDSKMDMNIDKGRLNNNAEGSLNKDKN